jgi:anti-anti-sigma regulatory factor
MSDLEITVLSISGHGAVLIYPVGSLTTGNRHRLRAAVLKCLADCPTAVIVDLSDCVLIDKVAAAIFVAVRREAAAGPAIDVLLCGASGVMAERIKALDPRQPLYQTRRKAVDAIGRVAVVAAWRRERFPAVPEATSLASCLVTDACADWRLPDLLHPARAVMFDLVRAAYVCSPEALRIVVSQRVGGLLLSVSTDVPAGHWDDCALDRRPQRDIATLPGTPTLMARYYRTAIVSSHLHWAYLTAGKA